MFGLILTAGTAVLTVYFFWRFWAAFRGLGRWHLAVAAGLAVLACHRYISRLLAECGWEGASDAVRLVGVVWLVLLFWFLLVGAAMNLWNVAVWLAGRVRPGARRWRLPPRAAFLAGSALVLAAAVWGWFEAERIGVRHVEVTVEHLPPGMETFRIAQLSDLHVGGPRSEQHVVAAADLLRDLHPDMVVSTGDMIDADFETIGHLAEHLAAVQPPFGKYAVFGNHDFYAGGEHSERFHAAAGFEVLRGRRVSPADGLELVGVDDPAARRRDPDARGVDEVALLNPRRPSATVILLKHQPRVADAAVGSFRLQLSGHTHGGQVFPFVFLTRLVYPYGPGRHRLAEGSELFVSRGTGTWGPPLRLASPPEVVVFTLRKAGGS